MQTETLLPCDESMALAAEALLAGNLVALPTETVYGLAAIALREEAVRKIFRAKERPADNPLIVHLAEKAQISQFAARIPESAWRLAEAFWPGPLTLIFPAKKEVPSIVTANLDTVALRMPAHPVALDLIRRSAPLAAPSANRSGRPSPTTAEHVLADMQGRIPFILDGGPCRVGIESTVLSVAEEVPCLYRPGEISREQMEAVIGRIEVAPAVYSRETKLDRAPSPGMRYRHYAPRAKLLLLPEEDFPAQAIWRYDSLSSNRAILCFHHQTQLFGARKVFDLGRRENIADLQHNLFAVLHALDAQNIETAYAPALPYSGKTLAYMNRLGRAGEPIENV